jgi:hypothetical protein
MNAQKIILSLWAFFFFALSLPIFSSAQVTFERFYGGTDYDGGYSVQQTSDGGYIITGSFGAGMSDVYLVKTDSFGDTLWTKTYGGAGTEIGRYVEQTLDGGYIIVGSNVWLIKTNVFGEILWMKTYDGTSLRSAKSGQQTQDGGYILVGSTRPGSLDDTDVLLIKTDSLGDTIWTKIYDGRGWSDSGNSVQQTTDGGYIIAGYTKPSVMGLPNVWLIKTDSSGDTLWTKTYGGSLQEYGYSVQQTTDGGYIITGETYSFSAGSNDVYLLKTDVSGDTLWTKTYGGIDTDVGWSVQQTSEGGYIIAGSTRSFGAGRTDVWLIKTDSSGDTLWTRTFGGSDRDRAQSVQQTADGGYIIAGYTESFGAGFYDVYLIKTDGNGLVGIEEKNSEYQTPNIEFRLLQNHPNPFNKLTAIGYQLKAPSYTVLNVYDITGRLVETLVDEKKEAGVYQVKWDGKDQSSGIYFYRLKAGDLTKTKKLILLR